jgi:HK97 family phage prohead protease
MGGFYEQIASGAFDDVLDNDVRAYFNHDENLLLGRVSSGTLRIGTDKRGLWYEVDLPETSYARDLMELMKRGDVNQSSFAFLIDRDRWEERDGKTYRIIEKVSRLLDVSPVSQPAYPDATSELMARNDKPESEGAEVKVATPEAEAENDINVFEYKVKLLNLD